MNSRLAARQTLRDALRYWSTFIAKCISQRLDTDRFQDFVQLVYAKYPLPPSLIADFFLRPRPHNRYTLDPRMPLYVQVLSQLRYIDAPAILKALYKHSALHTRKQTKETQQQKASDAIGIDHQDQAPSSGAQGKDARGIESKGGRRLPSPVKWKSSSWAEEIMFYHVIKLVVEGSAFRDSRGALDMARALCRWMTLFATTFATFANDLMQDQQSAQSREEMEIARAAFVPLLLRLTDNATLVKALSRPIAKAIRKELVRSLGDFVQTLDPVPQLLEKLEYFRTETLGRLDPQDQTKDAADPAMDELLDSTVGLKSFVVPDLLIATTRAGLYIYLNACLVGRPIIDDASLLSYLNARYHGNVQSSAIDLILASFDVLANAVFRNEGPQDAHILRSFLINRLPLLLRQLCNPEYSTASAEFCITEALNQVDATVFPTASQMFDESSNNNPYTESVREEFCAACALHGLIEREHVDRILGETSMSYEPSLQKSSKEKLVQECLTDPEKMQGLIRDLDKMDGNVGAVCQALVELMRRLCNDKETMSLKLLCTQLAQKPQSLDILLLFEKLPSVVGPLCQLLDNWRYEEDQGEYQPVYEEFGAVLLLVLAFAYRYNVSAADMGIQNIESAVAKIINYGHTSRKPQDITEQERSHINGWIQGLFDSEAGGLGDDLMSSCPPSEFYLLVAAIFQHIVVAYSHGYLHEESLKSGVEYLVDTFLLPSMAPAVRFLTDYIWIDQKEQKSVIKILQLILTPSSISGEATLMLTSVKNLIAKPLEHALRSYQRQDPKNQDIEPLIRSLKDNVLVSRRTGGAEHLEMESWANSSSTGLMGAIRHTIQGLAQWSVQPNGNPTPASYTHRQMLAGLKIMGPNRLLQVILEEIKQLSDAGSANIAYDVAAALICAPDVTHESPPVMLDAAGNMTSLPQKPLDLRDVLKSEAEDWKQLQKRDLVLAETVVRLHRRVEEQTVLPQTQTLLHTDDLPLGLGTETTELDEAMAQAAAAAAVSGDTMGVDAMAVDAMAAEMQLSGDLGGGHVTGSVDGTGDENFYGGLELGDWDGLDF